MTDPTNKAGYSFHVDGTSPPQGSIFVFGSNLAGRHGKGAAYAAKQFYGAIYGRGNGPQGRAYAIPTKGHSLEVLPLQQVSEHVDEFLRYAQAHPELHFFVTRVGCGLAKNDNAVVAPLFSSAPKNCSFAEDWRPFLEPDSAPSPRRRRP
jgi:hypothetical protein